MRHCCPHSRSAGKFFSLFANSYRRRFNKHGFERTQNQLLEGLTRLGFQDASLLEIGSGVGHLHQTLLERGAATAVGVELAPKMLQVARDWASERGLDQRTQYIEGDFIALAEKIEPADITLLDKVVCCYPDSHSLVHQSLAKTRLIYALTYPLNRWYTRLAIKIGAILMWLLRSDFRPYVHDPNKIEFWICSAGYEKKAEYRTFFWLTQLYLSKK